MSVVSKYHLADVGYTNVSGLLASYRSNHYQLNERTTGGDRPNNYKKLFNLRYSSVTNVFERTFGLLKKHGLY